MTREAYIKNKEVIEAWSNGATVEYLNGTYWERTETPSWFIRFTYRIKPKEEEILYEWMVKSSNNTWHLLDNLLTEEQMKIGCKDKEYRKTGREFKA